MTKTGFLEKNTNHYKYWFLDSVEDEDSNRIFFSAANINGLFCLNSDTGIVRRVTAFPGVPDANQLYRCGVKIDNKIYFPPRTAQYLAIYDLEDNSLKKVDMYPRNPFLGVEFHLNTYGYISVSHNESIFFMYRVHPICVVYNTQNMRMDYITCDNTGDKLILSSIYEKLGDTVIFFASEEGKFVILDLIDRTIEIENVQINEEDVLVKGVAKKDLKSIFIVDGKQGVFGVWDKNTRTLDVLLKNDSLRKGTEKDWIIKRTADALVMFPGLDLPGGDTDGIRYDFRGNNICVFDALDKYGKCRKWPLGEVKGEILYAVSLPTEDLFYTTQMTIIKYNYINNLIEEWELPVPEGMSLEDLDKEIIEYQEKARFKYIKDSGVITREGDYINLRGFINGVSKIQA